MTRVEVRLIGTIEVVRDGVTTPLAGKRVGALLVMLALADRAVPVDTLARAIWDDDPPERIRGSLQTYVGRLRRVIGAEAIRTESTGYRLALPADSVDLQRFAGLVARSADAEAAEAARILDEALTLWHAEPFGQAPSEWIEHNVVPEITEHYLQAFERRVDLALADGDAASRLPRLRQLVERHPLRESLWARLIDVLDAAGRTAEALERYEALRVHLADELGVDPAPDLQRAHQRLLSKEAPREIDAPTRSVPARQLPPAVVGFTGRSEQLAALDSALAANSSSLVALHGPGGVGKTSLAVHWASLNRDRFPDGQLFVDLRGYGPGEPIDPLEALDTLLRGLDVPGARIPADIEGRSALLRTELSDKRALVMLDNAREASQVRPLLSGAAATIVTSRSQLRGLVSRENARRIAVEPMPSGDAVALLAERFDISAVDSPEDLADLAELCGRLPVALSVAAERAGRDGTPRIAAVNERLRDERNRFEALTDWADDPLTDVRAVFSWSYHALGDDTARIFRLLGLHPHVRIATGAAAALAGLDERATERLLDKLTDRHLIAEIDLGWYELHDLSHAYAAELAADDSAESEAAVSRLRSWYLQSVRNARYVYPVPRVTLPLPEPLPGTSPARFGSREQAADWFVDHFPALRSVLTASAADGDDMTVALITPLLYRFLKFIGASREAVDLYTVAQECARRTGDREVLAVCTYFYAQCLDQVGDVDASLAGFQRARKLFADIDHPSGRLGVEITLGTVYAKLNRFDESIRTQEEALRDTDGAPGSVVALILNNLASTYLAHGRIAEAIETAQSAIDLGSGSDDFDADVVATAYVTLGESYSADERWAEAVRSLTDGAELFRRHGNVAREILVLQLRGTAHRQLGDVDAARTDWTTALELLDQIGRERVPAHLTAVPGTRDELLRLLESLDAA